MLFAILDVLISILIGLIVLTQIVLPLFCGLPVFWLFYPTGRQRVDFAIRCVWANVLKADKSKNKNNKTNTTNHE